MPLPISRTQLDRLGERLATGELSETDDALLERVLSAYDAAMAATEEVIADAGFHATARLKTTGTLVDKLRREKGMKLKGVQDIAGLRIVLGNDADQDAAVAQLVAAFNSSFGCDTKVRDRRVEPSFGYRAVHLIPKIDGLPVEVQVRSSMQDAWAQAFESLADQLGRQIRYGGEPDDAPTAEESQIRRDLVHLLRGDVATDFGAIEVALADAAALRTLQATLPPDSPAFQEVRERADIAEALLKDVGETLLDRVGTLVQKIERMAIMTKTGGRR